MSSNPNDDKHVVACIPYYKCQQYVRRAVDSLLAQTHKNLTIVVINDADFDTPPWPVLADIDDPRLVRFDLQENRGPYFATEIVLRSIDAPYLLIQDADDWSHPERVEILLSKLCKEKSDFVYSTEYKFEEDRTGKINLIGKIFIDSPDVNRNGALQWKFPHHGIFRAAYLNKIGGYYGGYMTTYDLYLTHITHLIGRISFVGEPLYYYNIRKTSLTHSPESGIRSKRRQEIYNVLNHKYVSIKTIVSDFESGRLQSKDLLSNIKMTFNLLEKETNSKLLEASQILKKAIIYKPF